MFARRCLFALLLVSLVCLAFPFSLPSTAATPANVASANQAIASAFSATSIAEQRGGNVTPLITTLNEALGLVAEAQLINATNPLQASNDLQNATQLAQQVSALAPSIGQAGAQAHELLLVETAVGIAIVIAVASLLYAYGDRIYRRIWFFLYKDYVVKSKNG